LIILSFLAGNAILAFILSLVTFIIFFRWESSEIPEKKANLDTLEKLAERREEQLEEVRALDRRIRMEQERSVRDHLISQRAHRIERLNGTNREMGIYCNEIRKQLE
jgi:type II secretory pathway component PulM